MSINSNARTNWRGDFASGAGRTLLATSGTTELDVNWLARSAGSHSTTTPEELLAAAHASCYSMALANVLSEAGSPPIQLNVDATVTFVPGTGVTRSELRVHASVPGISKDDFQLAAVDAKTNCPVSQALSGIEIILGSATLD
jgi:lipoyl-dependent peroxiredoxin